MSIRVEGDVRALREKLKHLSEPDLKGVNASLAELIRTNTLERFRETKDPDGKKWEQSIRAVREGGLTLTKTAGLKNSIKASSGAGGFAVGTNNIYAATHQHGDTRKITAKTPKGLLFKFNGSWVRKKAVTVNIPARPFLGINQEDFKMIEEQITKDVFGNV